MIGIDERRFLTIKDTTVYNVSFTDVVKKSRLATPDSNGSF